MMYSVTTEDKKISFSRWLESSIKIQILNEDETIIDELTSIINPGTITKDGTSYVRYTYNFDTNPTNDKINISDRYKLWLNKQAKLYIGLKTPRMDDYKWYSSGVFIFSEVSNEYSATSNTLSINCGDRMYQLDGTQNGELNALTTIIPAYEEDENGNPIKHNIIRNAFIDTAVQLGNVKKYIVDDIGEYKGTLYNKDYVAYREMHPEWNQVPYDLEFSNNDNVGSMLSKMIELYPNYSMYFDKDGILIAGMIPSCDNDQVVLTNDDLKHIAMTESSSTTLTEVRNVIHIWGQTFEVDWYSENVTSSSNVYVAKVDQYGDEYIHGDEIGLLIPTTNASIQYININGLGNVAIYDENTDEYLKENTMSANTVYVFKIRKKYLNGNITVRAYLEGQWQAHGLCALVDGSTSNETYICSDGATTTKYSKKYFQDKYNVETVSLKVIPNSPYTVQKIGERLKSNSDADFENITSDSLALARAEYELFVKARLTDSITITLGKLLPWLEPNSKVSYIKRNDTELKEYIIKKVTLNLTDGSTSIEMYTFYSLYEEE